MAERREAPTYDKASKQNPRSHLAAIYRDQEIAAASPSYSATAQRLPAVTQRGGQPTHREQDAALHQLVLVSGPVPAQQFNL